MDNFGHQRISISQRPHNASVDIMRSSRPARDEIHLFDANARGRPLSLLRNDHMRLHASPDRSDPKAGSDRFWHRVNRTVEAGWVASSDLRAQGCSADIPNGGVTSRRNLPGKLQCFDVCIVDLRFSQIRHA